MVNKYYQKHKERLWKEACERYLSEEEKDRRWKKAQERYQNLTEEEKGIWHQNYQECKQKLREYRKIII